MAGYVISLDQGTTSSRAVLWDETGAMRAMTQYPIQQYYPKPGWVEEDASEILFTTLQAMTEVLERSASPPQNWLPLESPISGKPPSSGKRQPESPSAVPLSGSAAEPLRSVNSSGVTGWSRTSVKRPVWYWILIFLPPRSSGSCLRSRNCAAGQNAVKFCLGPWTVG